jgi:GntR family transcriptional regulator, carbon starvation induced regulator
MAEERTTPLRERMIEDNRARIALETAALALSIEHGDEEWEARVVAAAYTLEKQDALLMKGELRDFERWATLNARFHAALIDACGSRWLLRQRAIIEKQCSRYRHNSVLREREQRNLLEEHRELAAAVIARDPHRAKRLLAAHYHRTAEGLVRLLGQDAGT